MFIFVHNSIDYILKTLRINKIYNTQLSRLNYQNKSNCTKYSSIVRMVCILVTTILCTRKAGHAEGGCDRPHYGEKFVLVNCIWGGIECP